MLHIYIIVFFQFLAAFSFEIKISYKPSQHYCYGSHHGGDDSNCIAVHAKLSSVSSYKDVLQFLESEDDNKKVRHIAIKATDTPSALLNEAVDEFLTPRPWWIVKEETYPWQVI